MSEREDVRSLILSKPGGNEFLAKLDRGAPITGEEMLQYFSPLEQERLRNAAASHLITLASQQIDPTTGTPFTGDRLIQRVAEMHFGGDAIPINASVTDVRGRRTAATYGESVAANYQQALITFSCKR